MQFTALSLNVFLTLSLSVFAVSRTKAQSSRDIGFEKNSGFETMKCADILKDLKPGTETRQYLYFNGIYSIKNCKATEFGGKSSLLGNLKNIAISAFTKELPADTPGEKCVKLNTLLARMLKDDIDRLAKAVQFRMTIYDHFIFERFPDKFTPGCNRNNAINTFAALQTRKRPNRSQKDEQLLKAANYLNDETNLACQIRENEPVGNINQIYIHAEKQATLEDRAICQNFLINWKKWNEVNKIKNAPQKTKPPVEDLCELLQKNLDCSVINAKDKFLIPAFANICLKQAYVDCASGGGQGPSSTIDRPAAKPASGHRK